MKIGKSERSAVFFSVCRFILLLGFLIFAGCNKKYYEGVAKAKEDNSQFVILKTGEKIEIKGAKMHSSSGTIVSIEKSGGKDFDKKDVQVVQNNTGYFKKFSTLYGSRFGERTNKGAVNIYNYTRTESWNGKHSFINFIILEMDESKETIISEGWPKTEEIVKMKTWFAKSEETINILSNWESLSNKKKNKYGKDIFKEAALKYNEEFNAGVLKN